MAIQEHAVFPQIQTRLNEMAEEQKSDNAFMSKEDAALAKSVRLDELERKTKE